MTADGATELTRRAFIGAAGATALWTCTRPGLAASSSSSGRLEARPGQPTGSIEPGEHPLGLATGRDGLVYIPSSFRPGTPTALAVMLHGAGGRARAMHFANALAERYGVVLVTPDSRGRTWDVILDRFGPDVEFINSALQKIFGLVTVDPGRLCVGGFSDGASYALTLGLGNGDLFTHVMAFSPGFVADVRRRGKPRVFDSHGTHDSVLPIDRTSRAIVSQLKRHGYNVTYHEFDGPHTVPGDIGDEGFKWLALGT